MELKPCPFCGGKATRSLEYSGGCKECDIWAHSSSDWNRRAPGWIPVSETPPPKDGTPVLIVDENGTVDVAYWVEQFDEVNEFVRHAEDGDVYRKVIVDNGYWNTEVVYDVTHWQPLPEPPV